MTLYSDKLADHALSPRNAGRLADANAVGEAGTLVFGDAVRLMLRVDRRSETITAARFQAFGGPVAIAVASILTELVTGRTLDAALAITADEVAEALGGLPRERVYASVLAEEAIRLAVANFRGTLPQDDGEVLCECFGVTTGLIDRIVRTKGLKTAEEVTLYTKAGGGCRTCQGRIEAALVATDFRLTVVETPIVAPRGEVLEKLRAAGLTAEGLAGAPARPLSSRPRISINHVSRGGAAPARALEVPEVPTGLRPERPTVPRGTVAKEPVVALKPSSGRLTVVEKVRLIEEALAEARPALKRDGGDCQLIDIDGSTIYVKLSGACTGCQMASVTLSGVQSKIVERLNIPVRLVPVM